MTNIFVIGIDGGTLDLIRRWAAESKLPNLERLMQKGVSGPLESTTPPMTSPAWPSFATGKYPDKHGVFDFVSARAGHFNIVNATALQARPLWDILSDEGKRVSVINVPVTWPPHSINGAMITGLLSPTKGEICSPPDLLTQLEDRDNSSYRVMPKIQYKPGNEREFLDDLYDLIDTRVRYAQRLLEREPWDFFMVHFLASDLIQHAMWRHMDTQHPRHQADNPYREAIQEIYVHIDQAIGKLLQILDADTTVMVMSDHGFGPLHGVVNLNILLWQQGLLKLKNNPWTRLRAFLFRHGLTPTGVYHLLVRFNLQNFVSRVSKSTRNAVFNKFLSFDDVDWEHTVAYSLGHMGQIFINVQGREPHGIIERGADYEQACERVIEALNTLKTPDGRPMLDEVIRARTQKDGPCADEGPDLHVKLDDYRYISCPLFATDGSVISKQIRGDSGSHRRNGIFIAQGPAIQTYVENHDARIVDLAPTILHLMELPVPDDMDGQVLEAIIQPDFMTEHPVRIQNTLAHKEHDPYALSEDEEAELESRLKGLGYLG